MAGFEGVVGMLRDESTRARAREFGGLLAAAFTALRAAGLAQADDAFGTAGGSLYFDDVFAGWREGLGEVGDHAPFVMRSGCYVTQDHGNYDHQSPLGELNELSAGEHLTPAIEVVTRVVSTPEPEFCVVNAGKRDLSYDVALPTMLWHTSPATPLAAGSAACVGLNDQHGMFRGPGVAALAVGDKVGLGISHPCTTFDKWRAMAMVDEQLRVRDLIVTFI